MGTPNRYKRPVIGPYGTAEWDEHSRNWKCGLTPEGRMRMECWLAGWPEVTRLLDSAFPGAARFARASGMTADEVEAVCRHAAVRAMAGYDPDNAAVASFDTYAQHWMRGFVQREAAARSKLRLRAGVKIVEGNRPLRTPDGESGTDVLTLIAARVDDEVDDRERLADLRRRVADVLRRRVPSRRNRDIFAMRHGLHDGLRRTHEQVGEAFGISWQRSWQIEAKVLAMVRDELEGLYLDLCR